MRIGRPVADDLTNGVARDIFSEQGVALVESAISIGVMLSALVGVVVTMMALYSYHFVADAAREASRYAMVRGSTSCSNTPALTNCNATPAEIQAWVRNLGYPGLNKNNLTVTTKWLSRTSSGSPPTTSWAACSVPCKAPGNMVQVIVTYAYPFNIPFWNNSLLDVTSTSEMVISQ